MASKHSNHSVGATHGKTISPLQVSSDREAAAALIRSKLNQLYEDEPDAQSEIAETEQLKHRSKHQQFMHQLVNSGKTLVEIQTAWHNYYVGLPDTEKHQVWKEFYDSNTLVSKYHKQNDKVAISTDREVHESHQSPKLLAVHPASSPRDSRNPRRIKQAVIEKVSAGGQLKAKHHIQSLLFGLAMGSVVLIIILFGLFNEVIIAPFIQPSRNASASPLIIDNNGVAPTATPEVIIPKINVEIPVSYDEKSTDEAAIENQLESGVVHYPTTSLPGQNGNAAFFGHSSNNIFNKGKYKFAFVLLHTLVPGDTFYLTNNGKVYVYKVITKTVVPPTEVSVLNPVAGHTATATLITCDPPGTSLNRLIIVGEQISPDVSTNAVSTATTTAVETTDQQTTALPGNGPSLFTRIWKSIF